MSRSSRPVLALMIGLLLMYGTADASSLFNAEGYGWWFDAVDPGAAGRGGTTVAGEGYGSAGAVNPSAIALTNLSFGFVSYGGEIQQVKGAEGTYRQRSDLLPRFGGVIVLPWGLRIGGALLAQTDATYERERRFEGASPYLAHTIGRGGWNRLQLTLAGRNVGKQLSWGLGLARVQGSVREDCTFDYDDPDSRDSRQVLEGRLKGGWIGTAGLHWSPIEKLRLGTAGSVGGSSRLIQESIVLRGSSYSESRKGRQELPAQWAFGVAGSPVRRLWVSVDWIETLWSQAGLTLVEGGTKEHPYEDAHRLSVGLELRAGGKRSPVRAWRAGYHESLHYVRTVTGEKITERAVSIGYREPIGRGRAAIDLSTEFGKRGDLDRVGAEERFVRLSIGIVFSSALREF